MNKRGEKIVVALTAFVIIIIFGIKIPLARAETTSYSESYINCLKEYGAALRRCDGSSKERQECGETAEEQRNKCLAKAGFTTDKCITGEGSATCRNYYDQNNALCYAQFREHRGQFDLKGCAGQVREDYENCQQTCFYPLLNLDQYVLAQPQKTEPPPKKPQSPKQPITPAPTVTSVTNPPCELPTQANTPPKTESDAKKRIQELQTLVKEKKEECENLPKQIRPGWSFKKITNPAYAECMKTLGRLYNDGYKIAYDFLLPSPW